MLEQILQERAANKAHRDSVADMRAEVRVGAPITRGRVSLSIHRVNNVTREVWKVDGKRVSKSEAHLVMRGAR